MEGDGEETSRVTPSASSQRRDELLLGYTKSLLSLQTVQDEHYVAALIALSKLSSPLPIQVLVDEILQEGGMFEFILRLIPTYLQNNMNDTSMEGYLTLSLHLLNYIFSPPVEDLPQSSSAFLTKSAFVTAPFLIQVLRVHSSSQLRTTLLIDTQIVAILHHMLVYHLNSTTSLEDISSAYWKQFWNDNEILLPILQTYRYSLTQHESVLLTDYRHELISILQFCIDSPPFFHSLLLDSPLLLEFLEFAPTNAHLFYLALQWTTLLLNMEDNNMSSDSSSNNGKSIKHLLKHSDVRACTLFSNLVVFGFKCYYNYNNKDDFGVTRKISSTTFNVDMDQNKNSTSVINSAIIRCKLFETVALTVECVGGKWTMIGDGREWKASTITKQKNDNDDGCATFCNMNTRHATKDITFLTCVRMASGELRIILDRILDIRQLTFGVNEDHQSIIILANTALHCIRILFAVVQDLIQTVADEDDNSVEKSDLLQESYVDLLHFETILKIKESMDDAIHAMFQFIVASAPESNGESAILYCDEDEKRELLFDSVFLLCTKCIKVWLSENNNDNAAIPTNTKHEVAVLRTLLEEDVDEWSETSTADWKQRYSRSRNAIIFET